MALRIVGRRRTTFWDHNCSIVENWTEETSRLWKKEEARLLSKRDVKPAHLYYRVGCWYRRVGTYLPDYHGPWAELRKAKRGVRLYFRVSAGDPNPVEYMSIRRQHQVDFEWFTSDLVKTYGFSASLNIAR